MDKRFNTSEIRDLVDGYHKIEAEQREFKEAKNKIGQIEGWFRRLWARLRNRGDIKRAGKRLDDRRRKLEEAVHRALLDTDRVYAQQHQKAEELSAAKRLSERLEESVKTARQGAEQAIEASTFDTEAAAVDSRAGGLADLLQQACKIAIKFNRQVDSNRQLQLRQVKDVHKKLCSDGISTPDKIAQLTAAEQVLDFLDEDRRNLHIEIATELTRIEEGQKRRVQVEVSALLTH